MPKRMLIDASHPEETRVVVLDGQKVEEFDFEAASKRPLKGNIYLAKVTRVEPSLQAAFVEYGGNRQGFLAFSEIHPDYYQIPVADRIALLAEQEADARRRSDDEFESFDTATAPALEPLAYDGEGEDGGEGARDTSERRMENDAPAPAGEEGDSAGGESSGAHGETGTEIVANSAASETPQDGNAQPSTENAPSQSASSHRPSQRWMRRRQYKIQEVIKRRQVILVQVEKEERGNKGAALTTYLSLAGRYCVLMPNTPRGGGISRKITNANDRKRLKSAAQALELPEGMGLIIRTAGENRTKVEIKRDYEYLLRMWDTIREITLKSNAPACVYEEGDLIKRAIRDLYNKDVAEVIVEGEDGYRNAKDFMRMLMPSHAKNVKQFKDNTTLYQKFHIEAQLDAMFQPTVTLKSGGYIVINQTEALVAIDVNSGRSTREHSIEDTAYKTNLEAAEEVARQLRLRDLAGLIVIDFIDMEDARNDRNVEKRLRDCVKNDRARVQIGKISQFGLLEMSRQRLRAGVVSGSTIPCPMCSGQGIVRSVESTALRVLRALDEEGQRQRANALVVNVPVEVALYALNQKRREIARMEQEYDIVITFQPKDELLAGTFDLERIGQRTPEERVRVAPPAPVEEIVAEVEEEDVPADDEADAEEAAATESAAKTEESPAGDGTGRRRRRRRRRGRNGQQGDTAEASGERTERREPVAGETESADAESANDDGEEGAEGDDRGSGLSGETTANGVDASGRRRRRRRRRGRRGPHEESTMLPEDSDEMPQERSEAPMDLPTTESMAPAIPVSTPFPAVAAAAPERIAMPNAPSEPVWTLFADSPAPEPARAHETVRTRVEVSRTPELERVADVPAPAADSFALAPALEKAKTDPAPAPHAPSVDEETASPSPRVPSPTAEQEPASPPRKGWWQRPFRLRD